MAFPNRSFNENVSGSLSILFLFMSFATFPSYVTCVTLYFQLLMSCSCLVISKMCYRFCVPYLSCNINCFLFFS